MKKPKSPLLKEKLRKQNNEKDSYIKRLKRNTQYFKNDVTEVEESWNKKVKAQQETK